MGVDELQIVDDIFNMNPPRMKAVCRAIEPYKMHITFPNGLRFDILDEEGCEALTRAGTYAACVAVETITPRLQELIKKHLRVERTQQAIRWMADRGVLVRGFFMLGFPTETLEEIQATIDYAVKSDLAQAYFFNVVPQPGTPLYDLALEENADALESQTLQEYNAKNGMVYRRLRRQHAGHHKVGVHSFFRAESAALGAADSGDALEELCYGVQ